jgi:hypothetical protein
MQHRTCTCHGQSAQHMFPSVLAVRTAQGHRLVLARSVFRRCSPASSPTRHSSHSSFSTFTFSMPREPRRCSQERRAREAERQRTHRRTLADATDPVVVARRDAARERQRDRQRLRRNRMRPANSSHVPAPFLPVHQQNAINNFMDRILTVRHSSAQCATCLERYHGMHMRGVQCDRCHREVRCPSLLYLHLLTDSSPALIDTATKTKQISDDFKIILDGVTQRTL